jgi:thioredoxin 1
MRRKENPMAGTTKALPLNDSNFDREVLQSDHPVLVDFWAAWCGPCRMVGPVVEELAGDFEGRAKVAKVDVDAAPGLARRFGVESIPTLIYFRNGKEIDRFIGAAPKKVLAAGLEKLIA